MDKFLWIFKNMVIAFQLFGIFMAKQDIVYGKVKGTSHHVVSGSPFSSSIKSPVWKQSGIFPGGAGVPW